MRPCLCLSCENARLCIWRTKLLRRATDYGFVITTMKLEECRHYQPVEGGEER